jgi:hypothetical protein
VERQPNLNWITTKETRKVKTVNKEVEVVTAELVVPASAEVAIAPNYNSGFNSEDFHIPRLNCIQKMSEIEGNPGDLVLDRRAVVLKPGKKLPVTVVSIRKSWTEKVPFEGEYKPKYANTPEEAADLKLQSNFPIIPVADIILLVPYDSSISTIDEEDAAELFPFLVGDTAYQLAKLTVQSFAFDHTFKIVNSFHAGNPNLTLTGQSWNLGSLLLERGRYSWYVPVLGRSNRAQDPEVLAFLNRLVNGQSK